MHSMICTGCRYHNDWTTISAAIVYKALHQNASLCFCSICQDSSMQCHWLVRCLHSLIPVDRSSVRTLSANFVRFDCLLFTWLRFTITAGTGHTTSNYSN